VPVELGGHNLSPLVEIGLTDLPYPAHPETTGLGLKSINLRKKMGNLPSKHRLLNPGTILTAQEIKSLFEEFSKVSNLKSG
jgi:hypothetical protein